MDSSNRNRIPHFIALIGSLTVQGVLADGITSYYPLVTEPSWVETSMDESLFDGNKTDFESTNLLGIDSENKLVMPIIPGFRGGNPVGTISHSDGGDFDDPFDTFGKTDESVDENGITLWKTLAGSLNGGSGQGAAGIIFESTTTYTTIGPANTSSDGVMLIRRKATIGEVVRTRYRQVHESTSSSPELNIDSRSVSIGIVEHRSVYAGTAMVPSLYPGSNPVLVTGPYNALVRITESSVTGTSETFVIDDGIETSLGVTDNGTSTITSIEWTVKGIGPVRYLFAFGEWLDPLMQNSIFNNGSNVVGVFSLEELIPSSDIISENLRASGGSLNDAADTILTTTGQEITLWPEPIEREIVFAPADAVSQLASLATDAGLTGNDLFPQAIPQNDGVENIIKYAFNMDLSSPDSHILSDTGTSGLPLVAVIDEAENKTFQLNYIRRKNSGLTYTPMYSSLLDPQSYVPFDGVETVNDIDASFERVSVELPVEIAELCTCFGIVKVEY